MKTIRTLFAAAMLAVIPLSVAGCPGATPQVILRAVSSFVTYVNTYLPAVKAAWDVLGSKSTEADAAFAKAYATTEDALAALEEVDQGIASGDVGQAMDAVKSAITSLVSIYDRYKGAAAAPGAAVDALHRQAQVIAGWKRQ